MADPNAPIDLAGGIIGNAIYTAPPTTTTTATNTPEYGEHNASDTAYWNGTKWVPIPPDTSSDTGGGSSGTWSSIQENGCTGYRGVQE